MDRKAAIATALAIVLGIGAAVFAVEQNIGFAGAKSSVGNLTQQGTPAPVAKEVRKPRIITVYVTPKAAPQQSQPVQVVDQTITVRVRRPSAPSNSSGGGSSTSSSSSSHHETESSDNGGGRDD